MVLSDHLMCIIPHKCIMLPHFHPTYKRIICRAQGGKKHEAILVSHILQNQKEDPWRTQIIPCDQYVQMCGYMVESVWW